MQDLQSLLVKSLAGQRSSSRNLVLKLALNWSEILGKPTADVTYPYRIQLSQDKIILYIAVKRGYNTIHAHMVAEIIEKLNVYLGENRIRQVKLVTSNLGD